MSERGSLYLGSFLFSHLLPTPDGINVQIGDYAYVEADERMWRVDRIEPGGWSQGFVWRGPPGKDADIKSLRSRFVAYDLNIGETTVMGLQRQVWLAMRTDGRNGSGTAADPFNVSTPAKFSSILLAIPEFSDIVLLPGTYEVYGWAYAAALQSRSFKLKPGWRFRGCGMGKTTLKLVDVQNTTDPRYYI